MATRVIDYSRCKPDILDRFWSKVDRSGKCWEWKGSRIGYGYGSFKMYSYGLMTAHRFIYMAFNGDIPEGQNVLHSCDNPSCVRPSHLFLGTQKNNVDDMIRKGRGSKPPVGLKGKGRSPRKARS